MVKNKKLLFKILAIVLMAIYLITAFSGIVGAADNGAYDEISVQGTGSKFTTQAGSWGNMLLGFFQVVGYIAAVIVLVWLGVKYIMASPEGKAEIKKQAFAYVLGAVLLFAAGSIVGWLRESITITDVSE